MPLPETERDSHMKRDIFDGESQTTGELGSAITWTAAADGRSKCYIARTNAVQ